MHKPRCFILVLVLCMLAVPCSGFASEPPELAICAESYPSEVVEFIILAKNDFSYRIIDPGEISAHSYVDFLKNHQNDTDILLLSVSAAECQELFQSGYCADLSERQTFRGLADRLPAVVRDFCYLDDTLFAVPVAIRFTEDTTIHTYEGFCALSENDGSFQITIAIVPQGSQNRLAPVFLYGVLRASPNTTNMLFPLQH